MGRYDVNIKYDIRDKKYREEIFKDINKRRANILLLKEKLLDKKIQWPIKIQPINERKATSISKRKRRPKKFIVKPLDKLSNKSLTDLNRRDRIRHYINANHDQSEDYLNGFIENFLSDQIKPLPKEEFSDNTISLIQDKSSNLLDKLLLNIANTHQLNSSDDTDGLDWEFIMGNMLQLGLPECVVDRVKRKMALITGKDTPAITAMNVVPTQLSDLTITSVEEELKEEVEKLARKSEVFHTIDINDPIDTSVKWLVDLDKKDFNTKSREIQKIQKDFTIRVLNLKPAFF